MSAETKAFLDAFAERAPSTMAPPSFPTEFCAQPAHALGLRLVVPESSAPPRRSDEGCCGRRRHTRQGDAELLPAAFDRVPGAKGAQGRWLPVRFAALNTHCFCQVDQVSIPATTGEFGVLPGHVPTVAQLKPGVLAVHLEADKNIKKASAAAQLIG